MEFYQTKFAEKLEEALKAVLPIIGLVLLLSFTIAPVPPASCFCSCSEPCSLSSA